MKYSFTIFTILILFFFSSCKKENAADAMGTFEADEIIVSARSTGDLLQFRIEEGGRLDSMQIVGKLDDKTAQLQKIQTEATVQSLSEKTADINPQIELLRDQLEVQKTQLNNAQKEQKRIKNLVAQNAATIKQLDEINTQVDVLTKQMTATNQQMEVVRSQVSTQNRSILSEKNPLSKQVDIINNQIEKSNIINPISGIVLSKYAMQGEFVNIGKPLYKIANLDTIYLKAYIDQTLLSTIKIGQKVIVRIDANEDYKNYDGVITWINNQSEFTPKTIQTKEERENLVYAIKIKVINDGYLKLGMYGEMILNK